MAGKRLPSREVRLASNAQLYALNRAGRLKLVLDEELEPIRNGEADRAIKASMRREAKAEGAQRPPLTATPSNAQPKGCRR